MKYSDAKPLFVTIYNKLTPSFLVAILIATLPGCKVESGLDDLILQSWSDCPNNATRLVISDDQAQERVQILTDGEAVQLAVDAENWELKMLSSNRYLLRGPLGEFRITNLGNAFQGARTVATGYPTTFATLKASFEIDQTCRDAQLWAVRGTCIPSCLASGSYFKWFETSTKCGFISGSITHPDNQFMLFDPTGEHCLIIKPLAPQIDGWEELIESLEHIRSPGSKNLHE